MFKRRMFAAVLIAATLFGTAASARAQTVTTINFFHTIPAETEAFVKSDLLPVFEKANPDCKVNLRNLGVEGAEGTALINSGLAAKDNNSPSLAWLASSGTGAFVKAGVLADVQKFFDDNATIKSNVFESLLNLSSYDGKIRSIPMTTNNVAVYVNVSAFKDAGVAIPSQDPEKTWTWDEFRTASKKVADKGKMKGYLFPVGGGWEGWLAHGWLAQAGGYFMQPDGTIGFNKPEAVEAYKFLKSMDDKSTAYSEPGKGWDPAPFLSQKVAMTINGPWNLSALLKIKDFEWTAVPLPRGKSVGAPLGGNQLFVFALNAAKDACAFKFAAYVLSDDFQIKFTIKDGSLPVTKSATASQVYADFAKNTPALAGWANQTKFGVARASIPAFDSVSGDGSPYSKAWDAIFIQGADIQSSMDKAAKDAQDLIDQTK